jgi:hypothetical protein
VVDLNNSNLHHVIIDTVLERGCAPTAAELAQRFQRPRDEVDTALHEFAQDHGVVLHPASDEIWVVHPFSMAPTGLCRARRQPRMVGTACKILEIARQVAAAETARGAAEV